MQIWRVAIILWRLENGRERAKLAINGRIRTGLEIAPCRAVGKYPR